MTSSLAIALTCIWAVGVLWLYPRFRRPGDDWLVVLMVCALAILWPLTILAALGIGVSEVVRLLRSLKRARRGGARHG